MSGVPPMTAGATVVVCAYTDERWEDLTRAIASLDAQTYAGGGPVQRVLVIDNNAELLEKARERWSDVLVIPNAGPRGLSHARNTGLACAVGDVVAFLDDDAAAAPGWLAALTAPFADPDVIASGGVAHPVWPGEATAPAVLPPELHWVVGCSFVGQERGESVRNVMGCNMAFRTAMLRRIGGFETSMGRVGRTPLGAEETDACIRLRRIVPGARIAFVPGAAVAHAVHPRRTGLRYVVARSYGEGLSKAALAGRLGAEESLGREREYATRVLPRAIVRELCTLRPRGAAAAGSIFASVGAAAFGYARGRVRASAAKPSPLRALPRVTT